MQQMRMIMSYAANLVAPERKRAKPQKAAAPRAGNMLDEMLNLAKEADDLPSEVSLGSLSRDERRRRLYGA